MTSWHARCPVCTLALRNDHPKPDLRHETPRCVLVERRWPIEPLQEASGLSQRQLAASLGLSTVSTAVRLGLSDWQADEWAVRLGFHPCQVWPLWDVAGLSVVDEMWLFRGGWRDRWLGRVSA